jgi:hypothetical protein
VDGGVLVNEDGSVLSSGPGGIMWNNPDTGKSGWLLREIDGNPINGINEMIPDGTGGIDFGTSDGVPLQGSRSVMYRGRSEVPGMPILPARFKLV